MALLENVDLTDHRDGHHQSGGALLLGERLRSPQRQEPWQEGPRNPSGTSPGENRRSTKAMAAPEKACDNPGQRDGVAESVGKDREDLNFLEKP